MKHKLQTLLSAAVGVMLALPASAARVDNRVFIEDAVSGYSSGTGWSLAGGADASQVEVSGGVMSFDLDADQNVTYTPATPSAADKAATVEVSGTTFSVAYEPPADLPEGSQASIVLGQWADGATGPTYYGWAGETNATGALVWTQLSSTVVSDPTDAVDVKMVFDYTAQTKTVSFFVDNVQVGSSLALADQDKTQVSAVSFSGAGSIADLDGTYAVNVYTVTFKDGTDVVSTVDVDEGETVAALPTAPDKTASGYSFTEWQASGSTFTTSTAVTADLFVTAQYNLMSYVITWLDGDGNSLGTSTVTHGATPAYTGATPTKTETTEYTYTFNDTWSPAIVPATAAATYTAQFDAVAKAFTITFVDEDGTTVLGTSRTLPGVVPVYEGETPAKASDNQNDYTFGGWSPALVAATGPTTYTATYSSTPRNYTITWNFKAADGTDTSDTSTVHWGDTPSHANPAGYVANNTIYAFQAWSPAPAAYDGTVAAYTATYTSTAAKATVITVTGVTTNTVGTYASLAEAVRAADDGDTVVLLANDTADATKTAQADRLVVTNAITIDFGEYTYSVPGSLEPTDNWCALFIDADTVVKGTTGGIDCLDEEDPSDPCGVYAFNVRNGAKLTIDGGVYHGGGTVVQAQLGTVEINSGTFSVTPYDEPYGTDFALNCVDANYPANAGFDIRGGTFVGFDPQDIAAEGEHTDFTDDGFVAIDDGNGNFVVQPGYNVTFEDYDGTVLETLRVPAGDTPAPTSAPTRADDVVESATSTTVTTYAFDGWTVAPATADVTYTATYTSTITVTDYVAQIAGGAKYATLAAAVAAAADGDTVVLLDDVTLTERVEPNVGANTAITIDLGGNKITRTGTSGNGSAFDVKSGDVTIRNGEIDCTQDDTAIAADGVYAITSRSGSTVTLADLDITVDSECGACAYPFAGSTMTIESGTYANVTTTPYRYNTAITGMAVNQPNNATQNLIIKGGSFSQYDPQLGDDSGAMTDFTDDGFVAIDDGNGHFVVQAGYNVTFDANGGSPVPAAQRVAAGDLATAPASNPAKTGDAQYSYAFSAWQLNGANYDFSVAPAADITLVADYTETVNEYTISWDTDGDGAVDDTTTVAYGTVPTHADGSKTGDAQYSYTFTGWDTEPVAVTGAATYTATFSTAVNEYTISWDTDGDGTVDDTTTVAYGTVPTHADGAKTADAEYTYTFTGWDVDPVAVTGVATYTAQFDQTPVAPPLVEGVTLALKGDVYLDAVSITNPAVVKFVATTNGAAADVTPTVTASAGAATVSGDTVTFTGLPWNDPVDWTLAYNGATLPGRFYAKAETQWFSESTNSFTDIQGLVEGMKGVERATGSATNQMVRIEVTIEIPDGAMDSLPTGTDVGDSRTGFAVAQLTGDAAPAYYGYNGTNWVKLVGAAPAANTEVDLLIVLDTAESKARYYVDGVALSTTNATPVYAIPMKAGDAVIKGIGFANPEGVKSAVVAEYDVPYAAAVGDTPYMVGAEGVAAADKTGTQTLYLLENGITGSVTLDEGETLVVDRTKGDDLGLAVSAATGCELTSTTNGTVVTWTATAAASVEPEAVNPGDSLDPDTDADVIPAGVVTETDPNTQEETQYFVVNFRAPQAGITYTLMTTTDLTLTTDQWKGIGEVGEVATKAAGDDAEKVSTEANELITLKTPMTGNAAFFKIKASVGN